MKHNDDYVPDALAAILGPQEYTIRKAKRDYRETQELAMQEMGLGMFLASIKQAKEFSNGH